MFSMIPHSPKTMVDGTFGRGGHSRALLERFNQLKVWGIDRDEAAHAHATEHFAQEMSEGRLEMFHGSYAQFFEKEENAKRPWDAVLLDLGVSSPQLDQAERGFSFYHNGPLDMRMNQQQQVSAETIINTWDEEDLIDVFKNYGEIHSPYRVIRAILHDRKLKPFTTTHQLAGLIERVDGWRQKGKHPATQYFLGLRLIINQELENLKTALPLMIQSLVPGGVIVILSFHSLEDRIVKNLFKEHDNIGYRINKKVMVASDDEQKENPRSRSAKLRGFQRRYHEDISQS